jgi:phage terminase large subunit-like protein
MKRRPKLTEYRFDQWADDLKSWIQESVSPFENDTPEKQRERKARGREDRLYFLKTYLPHYFYGEFEDFHEEWSDLADITNEIVGVAAPRKHAKSTFFTLGVPIHDIAYALKHFIMVISDSNDQASGFTIAIRLELEVNPRLKHDFGDLQSAYGRRGATWKQNDFTTSNGVRVLARGRGEKVRGLKNVQYRPDRIIVDDLENDQNVKNPAIVKAALDWLLQAVLLSVGDEWSFLMVGNVFAPRSVLSQIINAKDEETGKQIYVTRIYDCYREDGAPLWPAMWPLEKLDKFRRQIGTVRFNREMRNRVGAEESPIREEWITYVPKIEILSPKNRRVAAFLDPSGKGTETTDFKAIVVVGRDDEGFYDTMHAWIRHATVNEMWKRVWEVDEEFGCGMGVEINMFQDFLIDSYINYAERMERHIRLQKVNHSKEKISRIVNRISPLVEYGKLRFVKGQSDQDLLVEQLIYIMDANVNDDGPDALEGALSIVSVSPAICIGRDPERRETAMGGSRGFAAPGGRGMSLPGGRGFFGRFGQRVGMFRG